MIHDSCVTQLGKYDINTTLCIIDTGNKAFIYPIFQVIKQSSILRSSCCMTRVEARSELLTYVKTKQCKSSDLTCLQIHILPCRCPKMRTLHSQLQSKLKVLFSLMGYVHQVANLSYFFPILISSFVPCHQLFIHGH